MFDVSIVIVSWNTRELVRQCLASLPQGCGRLTREILVVDNASSDGTPEMVQTEFPDVVLIRNQANLGFAKANNLGVRSARGKYVCLINSDVNVPAGCIEKMFDYMEGEDAVGLLGPKMLSGEGVPSPSCMQRPTLFITFINALGLSGLFQRAGLHMKNFHRVTSQDVDVLNGWFWMARRRALDNVGLLDEQFFMYGEDIDWCDRFWGAGWRVVYFPQAAAIHYGAASSARAPIRFYIEMHRANLQYWKRHHGALSQAAYLSIVILHHVCRVLGYGAVYALYPPRRSDVSIKISRSAACLRWLFGAPLEQQPAVA